MDSKKINYGEMQKNFQLELEQLKQEEVDILLIATFNLHLTLNFSRINLLRISMACSVRKHSWKIKLRVCPN